MEEKRCVVPFPPDAKYMFLLCNRHLPAHLQLPEVMCSEASNLFSDGAYTPLVLIFKYCAIARKLFLDDVGENASVRDASVIDAARERQQRNVFYSGSEMSDEESLNS